jgi:hypothetical protein
MQKIVLISCVSLKKKESAQAKYLYISALFKKSLEYSLALKPDRIFILSAHYYLLELEEIIEPYDVTLSYVSPSVLKKKPNLKVLTSQESLNWGRVVLEKLSEKADLENDEFIIVAGQAYIKPIESGLNFIRQPLRGLPQGKRINELNRLIANLDLEMTQSKKTN